MGYPTDMAGSQRLTPLSTGIAPVILIYWITAMVVGAETTIAPPREG